MTDIPDVPDTALPGTTGARPGPPVNLVLLDALSARPHPLLHIPADTLPNAVAEALRETRTAHHLLDLTNVPYGVPFIRPPDRSARQSPRRSPDNRVTRIDARTYLATRMIQQQGERLSRIADWHSRESGPSGTFGDLCSECGRLWPCDTRRLAGDPNLLHPLD